MSKSGFKLESANNSPDWDLVVAKSPQGTLFSERAFLAASGAAHHLYFVKQGDEIKAGVALVVSPDGKKCELNDLIIYGGFFFNLSQQAESAKKTHDEFIMTEFIVNELSKNYQIIEFQTAPLKFDLRPFLWFNYHENSKAKYILNLRYTSILSLKKFQNFIGKEQQSPCFMSMDTLRRRHVRDGEKKGGRVENGSDAKILTSYYCEMMARQKLPQNESKIHAMEKIISLLLNSNRGLLLHVHNKQNQIVYCIFYAWDNKRAYYLFGAGNPAISEPWQGSFAHWQAFIKLCTNNIFEVDLEGINSPNRGWFKVGLGGSITPYYHLKYSLT